MFAPAFHGRHSGQISITIRERSASRLCVLSLLQLREHCQLASVHKCLRIRDLCKELGIIVSTRILHTERERQAKTDACLVPSCPLASMVPVFWR
jgi:hypothetical protein